MAPLLYFLLSLVDGYDQIESLSSFLPVLSLRDGFVMTARLSYACFRFIFSTFAYALIWFPLLFLSCLSSLIPSMAFQYCFVWIRGIRAVRSSFLASGRHYSLRATYDRNCMNIIECVVFFFSYVRSRQIPLMFEHPHWGYVRVTRVRRAEIDDFSSSRKVLFFSSHSSSVLLWLHSSYAA